MQKKTRARSPLACLHMHHVKPAPRPYYYEHNDLRRRVLMGGGPAAKIWLALAAAHTRAPRQTFTRKGRTPLLVTATMTKTCALFVCAPPSRRGMFNARTHARTCVIYLGFGASTAQTNICFDPSGPARQRDCPFNSSESIVPVENGVCAMHPHICSSHTHTHAGDLITMIILTVRHRKWLLPHKNLLLPEGGFR